MSRAFKFWHHHGGLSVPDLDASIAWWKQVLGFELERRFFISTIPAEVAMLGNGPLHIELFMVAGAKALPPERREPDTDVRTHGNKHVSFAVDNAAEFAEELEAPRRRYRLGESNAARFQYFHSPRQRGQPAGVRARTSPRRDLRDPVAQDQCPCDCAASMSCRMEKPVASTPFTADRT